jgi:hypothetical protein
MPFISKSAQPYEAIESNETDFDVRPVTEPKDSTYRRLLLPCGVAIVLFIFFTASMWIPRPSAAIGVDQMTALGECKPCTFFECKRTLCPADKAPMVCTKGAAHDGCADTSAAWLASYVCDDCCDSSHCATTKESDTDEESGMTKCTTCTKSECQQFNCPATSPYICLGGGATGGCSDDKWHWPSSLNNICTKCCDAESC